MLSSALLPSQGTLDSFMDTAPPVGALYDFEAIKTAAQAFRVLGMSKETIETMSYENFTKFLEDIMTIIAVKEWLSRLLWICTQHTPPSAGKISVKVFLSSYLISFKPLNIFQTTGERESELKDKAEALLSAFHAVTESVFLCDAASDVPSELLVRFRGCLSEYLVKFRQWDALDREVCKKRVKEALVALYQCRAVVSVNSPNDSPAIKRFDKQIEALLAKLLRLGGDAAVAEIEREQKGIILPRSYVLYANQPHFFNNEQLSHELLLDPSFQLSYEDPESSFKLILGENFKNFDETWEKVKLELSLPNPEFRSVLKVLEVIRGDLVEISALEEATEISTVLNVGLLKAKSMKLALRLEEVCGLVPAACGVLCRAQAKMEAILNAPAPLDDEAPPEPARVVGLTSEYQAVCDALRDAEEEQRGGRLVDALQFMLDKVKKMAIMAANTRLRVVARVIRSSGIDYERTKLKQKLASGELTLRNTERSISEALTQVVDGSKSKEELLDELAKGNGVFNVYLTSIFHLISSYGFDTASVPEVLRWDWRRLLELRHMVDYTSRCAALLFVSWDSLNVAESKMGTEGSKGVRLLFDSLCELVVSGQSWDFGDVSNAASKLIEESDALRAEDKASLLASMKTFAPSDPDCQTVQFMRINVNHYVRCYVRGPVQEQVEKWEKIVVDGREVFPENFGYFGPLSQEPSGASLPVPLESLVSKLEAIAEKIRKLAGWSWWIHCNTLQPMIVRKAEELRGVPETESKDEASSEEGEGEACSEETP